MEDVDPRLAHKLRLMAKRAIPKDVRKRLVEKKPFFSDRVKERVHNMAKSGDRRVREAAKQMIGSGFLDKTEDVVNEKVQREHDVRLTRAVDGAIRRGEIPRADPRKDKFLAQQLEIARKQGRKV